VEFAFNNPATIYQQREDHRTVRNHICFIFGFDNPAFFALKNPSRIRKLFSKNYSQKNTI
jgi:hypothetical protein